MIKIILTKIYVPLLVLFLSLESEALYGNKLNGKWKVVDGICAGGEQLNKYIGASIDFNSKGVFLAGVNSCLDESSRMDFDPDAGKFYKSLFDQDQIKSLSENPGNTERC